MVSRKLDKLLCLFCNATVDILILFSTNSGVVYVGNDLISRVCEFHMELYVDVVSGDTGVG